MLVAAPLLVSCAARNSSPGGSGGARASGGAGSGGASASGGAGAQGGAGGLGGASAVGGATGLGGAGGGPEAGGPGGAVVAGAPLLDNVTGRFPAADAPSTCIDPQLRLTFKVPVSVGEGRVQIWEAGSGAADALVDTLRFALPSNPVQPTYSDILGVGTTRTFRFNRPLYVDGTQATIVLRHAAALKPGRTYYVTVDSGLFLDAAGASLGAIVDPASWRFTIGAGVPANRDSIVVALDGDGDFCSVQGAVDAVPANNTSPVTITVKTGTYREILFIKNKALLALRGEDRKKSIIAYANNEKLQSGTALRAMIEAEGSSEMTIENITLQNLTPQDGGQAEALRAEPAEKLILRNVDVKSLQDTLLLTGRIYVVNSAIEGNVDFIWGKGTAYFEKCDIKVIARKGYNVQARNAVDAYGYVFVDTTFTTDRVISGHYLGRIDVGVYPGSHVAYVNARFTAGMLDPTGWITTNAADTSKLRFWEYQSTDLDGNPLDVSMRNPASKQLTEAEAAMMRDKAVVFGGTWSPAP